MIEFLLGFEVGIWGIVNEEYYVNCFIGFMWGIIFDFFKSFMR